MIPDKLTPVGDSLTTQLREIQSEASTLKTRVSTQTQIIFNPSTSTRTEDLNPDTNPNFLITESNRLNEKFKRISLTCTASDPKTIAQMREIALELERDAIAIEGFKVLLATQPKEQIDVPKRTNSILAVIDTVQANLGRFGRFKVRRQTRGLGFNTLLNKINRSTEQLHQNIKRSPPVETFDERVTKFQALISTFEKELGEIQLKATNLNSMWDVETQDTYAKKVLDVKGKIQMLQWEQEAFLRVFNPETQKVLDAESGIHAVLKKVNAKNSGFKVCEAMRIHKNAEERLAYISEDSNAYIVACQALKTAKAEIDATVKKYEIPNKEQQRIGVELTKDNPTIREGLFHNDLPVVAQVLSQKIQAIRLETNAQTRQTLIEQFEDMWSKLSSQQLKLLDVKQFEPILKAYQNEYGAEIEAARTSQLNNIRTPAALKDMIKDLNTHLQVIGLQSTKQDKELMITSFDEKWGRFTPGDKERLLRADAEFSKNYSTHRQNVFQEMVPRLITQMKWFNAAITQGIFRQEPVSELAAFHQKGRSIETVTDVHILARALRNLISDLRPPLLSNDALSFEIIEKNRPPEFMKELSSILQFLNRIDPQVIDKSAIAKLWGPVFFGRTPDSERDAIVMQQAVLAMMEYESSHRNWDTWG